MLEALSVVHPARAGNIMVLASVVLRYRFIRAGNIGFLIEADEILNRFIPTWGNIPREELWRSTIRFIPHVRGI